MQPRNVLLLLTSLLALATAACPSTLSDCNGACYSPSEYCCPNGQLTQKQFCPSSTPSTSASPSSSSTQQPTQTDSCQAMFSQQTCRTSSEDPSQVNAQAVADARGWLCYNFPQYCTEISSGGKYSSCNSVEQLTYAMTQYYKAFGPQQGSSACDFGGLARIYNVGTPTTSSNGTPTPSTSTPVPTGSSVNCQSMFSQQTCRTASEDPSQVDAQAVADARGWLCYNFPQYCTEINNGGKYSSCNSVEQLTYAMTQYYNALAPQQGSGACDFGGLARIYSVATSSSTVAPSTTSTPASTTKTDICASKTCSYDQACCPTPYGAQCYTSQGYSSYIMYCRYDDLGNANVCGREEISCGSACYPVANYQCKNGVAQPRTIEQLPGPNYVGNPNFNGTYIYPWKINSYSFTYPGLSLSEGSVTQTLLAPANGNFILSFYLNNGGKSTPDVQSISVGFNGVRVFGISNSAKAYEVSQPGQTTKFSIPVNGSSSGSNTITFAVSSDGRPFYISSVFLGYAPSNPDTCSNTACDTGATCCPTKFGPRCTTNNYFTGLSCRRDDVGNSFVCGAEEIGCGDGCYAISQYTCLNGVPSYRTLQQLSGPNLLGNPGFEDPTYLFPWTRNYYAQLRSTGISTTSVYNGQQSAFVLESGLTQTFIAPASANLTLSFYWRQNYWQEGAHWAVDFNSRRILVNNDESATNGWVKASTFVTSAASPSGTNTVSFGGYGNYFLDDFFVGVTTN